MSDGKHDCNFSGMKRHMQFSLSGPWNNPVEVTQCQICVWPWRVPQRSIKVKGQDAFLLTGQRWTLLSIGTMGLEQPTRRYGPFASSSSKVIFCGFWKADIDFQKVFHSNHIFTSHRQEDIDDFHIHDIEMTSRGHSRSNVMSLRILKVRYRLPSC